MQKISRSFGTHDGTFHADEVTACALLDLFNLIDDDKIKRTRDPVLLSQCEYVCDVGGIYDPTQKLFDHHQVSYDGNLSSAGMILLYLKEKNFLSTQDYEFLNHTLIIGVDNHDNGRAPSIQGLCSYSNLISNFTPITHECQPETQDKAFMEAFYFACSHLSRLWRRHSYSKSCKEFVAKAMEVGKEYLFFDHSIPWMESFFELDGAHHPAKFIIMPSGKHWKLRGIPPSLEKAMMVRAPLPKEWAGLLQEDLRRISEIPGAIFCHKGLFISVWETLDNALQALHYALNSKEASP
jgi:uncharacterized UPF0160 family protein